MEKIYKDEKNKARIDLVDPDFICGIAEVLGFGAEKYEPYSFQKVTGALDKYYAAAMRHMLAWRTGNFTDLETGQSHLLHAACNIMFLLRIQYRNEVGPLMPLEKLQEIWEKLNGSKDDMGQPEPAEECVNGSQTNYNEGYTEPTPESKDSAVPMVRWPPEYIRACGCVIPLDGGQQIVHGSNTDT